MNDVMSGGLHRVWKDEFVRKLGAFVSHKGQSTVESVLLCCSVPANRRVVSSHPCLAHVCACACVRACVCVCAM